MTFAQAVNQELRNTFGSKWIASAFSYGIIVAGLGFVAVMGLGLMDFADTNIVQALDDLK